MLRKFCRLFPSVNGCCHKKLTRLHVRYSATVGCGNGNSAKFRSFLPVLTNIRHLGLGPTSKDFEEPAQITGPLTKAHANELVLRLNDEERKMLFSALQEYASNKIKEEFEGNRITVVISTFGSR